MNILQATISDAEEILVLQKLAYRIEAVRYNDYNIPPLMQTLEEIEKQFKDHLFLKAVSENLIIGTVRAHEENGTCYIGKLAVYLSEISLPSSTLIFHLVHGTMRE